MSAEIKDENLRRIAVSLEKGIAQIDATIAELRSGRDKQSGAENHESGRA